MTPKEMAEMWKYTSRDMYYQSKEAAYKGLEDEGESFTLRSPGEEDAHISENELKDIIFRIDRLELNVKRQKAIMQKVYDDLTSRGIVITELISI